MHADLCFSVKRLVQNWSQSLRVLWYSAKRSIWDLGVNWDLPDLSDGISYDGEDVGIYIQWSGCFNATAVFRHPGNLASSRGLVGSE